MNDDLLKVLIVDDERLVRNLLKACISWEDIGLTIIGESSGAVEGIQMVDKLHPDIIFTDICMPAMDGLEFSKRVIEEHPHIKIIILTGHEEFEYAKKGIKVGIADFLLKPINRDEIRKTALTAKAKIIRERIRIEEYDRLKDQLQQNMPFLKEKLFNELVQSGADLKLMKEKLSYFCIEFANDTFRIAVVDVSNTSGDDNPDEEMKLILRIRGIELIKQYFKKDHYVNCFLDNSQMIVIICNDSSIDLWECCESIKSMLINRLKCFINIGIGNAYDKMERIHVSYREACYALKYRFIVGNNQIVCFSDIYAFEHNISNIDYTVLGSFCFYLKSGLKEKADELIRTAFNELKSSASSKEQVRVFACNFIANILNVLVETRIKQEEIFEQNSQPFEKIFKLDTLPEMEKYIQMVSQRVIQSINSMQGKKAKKIIQDVKDYIDANYSASDLTLADVAKRFYVNMSYLSRAFKEETGLPFIEYLYRLRMENAIRLLNETDKKAYQIAEEIGINDSHYFSACFKKYTGVSVNEYKKSR